ncbi:hypothetical protein [Umezakia ovalisporum]|jgi:hypothetical protein|uniref:Uncharacterized protein n=2 Tax=Umezakia ovalisporum TaxID=75695 RepID=A0AA43H0W5_9CYAN|nr:hypothetical protein [Umezakia ovalisporum]MBI1242041.1 hypothetical protein [Nostoc sp. RI_552]MDH6056650.1 hypothetical protein [Umezakia ovalisporum FSS-43]MDH6065125.1 hypothetical protein [Umezakia ovalisporum FSS-62]MDH6067314.1 hypothetical protein [Umezakia ovalisporum APH033B]MDH6070168.1 hypothetical protein [Umezakia ovalisporum CobakiLakeA]
MIQWKPPLIELVKEIIAINQGWKLAEEIGDYASALSDSLAELKNRLQVQLLRNYAPEKVYLQIDTSTDSTEMEELYGLILREPIEGYWNAAHLPVRVAEKLLSAQEIEQFIIPLEVEKKHDSNCA